MKRTRLAELIAQELAKEPPGQSEAAQRVRARATALRRRREKSIRRSACLALLAIAAPIIWVVTDGGGSTRRVEVGASLGDPPPPGRIETIAGAASGGNSYDLDRLPSGDGGPATQAVLAGVHEVAVDHSCNVYLTDGVNHVVRRVDPQGTIETFLAASTFTPRNPEFDSGELGPMGLAVDESGHVFIAEGFGFRVYVAESSSLVTVIAGTGAQGRDGEGGLAADAELWGPTDVAVGSDGAVYIADSSTGVRKIRSDGTVLNLTPPGTVAGATYLALNALAISPDNDIYFSTGSLLGEIQADGTVRTVTTELHSTWGLAFSPTYGLFASDDRTNRVYHVGNDGSLTPVAGTGTSGGAGDGGLALDAQLDGPEGLAFGPDGSLFIAEAFGGRIRRVTFGDDTGVCSAAGSVSTTTSSTTSTTSASSTTSIPSSTSSTSPDTTTP